MTQPYKEPTVSVTLIKILKSYATRVGVDFSEVAEEVGFDLAVLEDGNKRVSGKHFESLWQKIVSVGEDPNPGLNFGREMARHYPGGSLLFTMMMNCGTVGCALDAFIRYHRIMADVIQPQLHRDNNRIHLSWNAPPAGFPHHPHLSEALICMYYSILEHLGQDKLQPVEVCFTHPGPDDLSAYRQVFKAPIRFAAEKNELVIEADALDIEIQLANRDFYKILENHADRIASTIGRQSNWTDKVTCLTRDMVIKGLKPNIDRVAEKLALSRRSLQGKLKAEETTFRHCLETTRRQIALDYIAKPEVTICEVAFLLGYSEQSAFNHAFKRWTGKTPKAYYGGTT